MNLNHSKIKQPPHLGGRRLPSLNMLRAFEAAARLESVTLAAQELNVTQSAVSHQIKALEEWLGTTLVKREGRRLGLTEPGRVYLPGLSQAFDLMVQATSRLERLNRRITLCVNATATLASQWLIPRLSGFCQQVPSVDVQIATTAGQLDFDPSAYDVSIRCFSADELSQLRTRPNWRGIVSGAFVADQLTPVCSPTLVTGAKRLTQPGDLTRYPLLHSRSTPLAWRRWFDLAGIGDVDTTGGLVFDHAHQCAQAAIQGLGVTLGNPQFLAEPLSSGLLVAPFASLLSGEKNYYWLLSPRAAEDKNALAFCAWLDGLPSCPSLNDTATERPVSS